MTDPSPDIARSRARTARAHLLVVLAALVLAGTATACGGGSSGTRAGVKVSHVAIPAPASPDVAAAYFTVRNESSVPDVLETARTSVSPLAGLHETVERDGVSTMVTSGPVTIPGHGTLTLAPGARHLMITNARPALRVGQHVTITLVFRRAGIVRVTAPVVDPGTVLAGT